MTKKTVSKRFPTNEVVDPKILAQELHFKTSGRTAKNRFFKAAMSELQASHSKDNLKGIGIPTDGLVNLYEKWGHGGFGVVLTGNIIVDHMHLEGIGNMVLSKETDSPEKLNQFRRLTTAAKSNGSLFIAQINHCGRQTPSNVNATPFSASDVQLTVRIKTSFGKPIPLTTEQIKTEVVDRFVYTAVKCYEAGFDGVELHAAHGYLLSQFLSPTTNKRTDKYGGDPENRSRVVEEIYLGIKEKIPPNSGFIVGIKLNSADCPQSGTLEDVKFIGKKLDRIGFDFIELSGGSYENWTLFHYKESTKAREAFFVEFSAALKPEIKNSVIYLTGGFRTVPGMVKAIENGDTDGIGLAKSSTAELDIAHKMLNNEVQGAAFNYFETDYAMAGLQSQTQMWQAGRTSWSKSEGDPSFGVSDFSDDHEMEKFKTGALKHTVKIAMDPDLGIFEYDAKQNYSFLGSSFVGCIVGMYSKWIGFKK